MSQASSRRIQRVPAALALRCLAQSGIHISPITLRSWVYRGHITRQRGGYDLEEILAYLDRRDTHSDPVVDAGQDPCNDQPRTHVSAAPGSARSGGAFMPPRS